MWWSVHRCRQTIALRFRSAGKNWKRLSITLNIWRYLKLAEHRLWRLSMWPTISCYRRSPTINGYRHQRGIYLPHKHNRSEKSYHGHGGWWPKEWGRAEVWAFLIPWLWSVSDARLLRVGTHHATRHSRDASPYSHDVCWDRTGGILPNLSDHHGCLSNRYCHHLDCLRCVCC